MRCIIAQHFCEISGHYHAGGADVWGQNEAGIGWN